MVSKHERIERRKKEIGSKKHRKFRVYKSNFIELFNFFFRVYRQKLFDFPGSIVNVYFDGNSEDAKFTFRLYENGDFKNKKITTKHPNILKSVIIGKKSFGLFLNEYAEGIAEGSFLKSEILDFLISIDTPQCLILDLENKIISCMLKKSNIC